MSVKGGSRINTCADCGECMIKWNVFWPFSAAAFYMSTDALDSCGGGLQIRAEVNNFHELPIKIIRGKRQKRQQTEIQELRRFSERMSVRCSGGRDVRHWSLAARPLAPPNMARKICPVFGRCAIRLGEEPCLFCIKNWLDNPAFGGMIVTNLPPVQYERSVGVLL